MPCTFANCDGSAATAAAFGSFVLPPLPLVSALATASFAGSAAAAAAAATVGVVIGWPAVGRVPTTEAIFARRAASPEARAMPSAYGTRLCARSSELPALEVRKEMNSFTSAAFGLASLVTRYSSV